MVTTRRKSAVTYKDASDDEMDVDGFDHDYDAPSSASKKSLKRAAEDELEYDSDEDEKPKKKKTRTGKTTKRKGKVTARSLMKDLFTTLPLDLIYEIFGHLHPLDLLQVARTSRLLRSHLMSKRSISVWKTAREAVLPSVPDCPKDQSEPQWAMLLFTHDCTICGTPRIQKVDWNLRLRGCEMCFKAHIIYSRTATKTYPEIEDLDTVLEVLPWTNVGGWAHGHSSSRKFYFSKHIIKMAQIVDDFQLRVDAGVKGARAEFDEWIEKKKAEATEQAESGKELKQWAQEAARTRNVTNEQLKKQRKEAIIAKLVELGHDPRDVQNAANTRRSSASNIFDSTTQLSDAAWKRIKAKAEMLAETEKQARLDIEQRPIRDARRKVAKARYEKFKETYDSSPDGFMPDESKFIDIPAIKSVIQSDGDGVSSGIFDDVFDQLPAFFDEWRRVRRVELARVIVESQSTAGDAKPDPVTAEQEGILLLATSFFATCTQYGGYGHDESSVHWMRTLHGHFPRRYHPSSGNARSPFEEMRCIRVVPESVERAKELIRAVGLDPNTATSLEMDALDARFWCNACSVLQNKAIPVARSWRNCVSFVNFCLLALH
ncbi:hypothetical protein FS837_011110 [Tulasnella sp. UAMH 9824]|nr:hypothetical protein FS837_011110 [Tulasnella sp. UAMH 9824]